MADITIDMGPNVNRLDLKNLRQQLSGLSPDDQITIRLEAADEHQSGGIVDELERQGFDFQPRGSHGGKDFYIIARKKNS